MLFRTWAFVIALFFVLGAYDTIFPSAPPQWMEADFGTVHRSGELPSSRLTLKGGDIGSDLLYTERFHRINSLSFILVPEDTPADSKPEARILYKVPTPKDTDENNLTQVAVTLVPESFSGCISETSDPEKVKFLVDSGYQVKLPLLEMTPCSREAAPASPLNSYWGLLGLPVVLYGLWQFLRLFRLCYRERREAAAEVDDRLMPEDLSLGETVRTAKAGFNRWKLLRESCLDAACHYVPRLALYRLKDALPRDVGRVSLGAWRQLRDARREGRLGETLREMGRNPLIVVSNVSALVLLLSTLILSGRQLEAVAAMVGAGIFFGLWFVYARYLGMSRRKALSATFVYCLAAMLWLSGMPQLLQEEGVLIKLPFLSDSMTVIHPDLLSLPWVVLFAPLSYVVLVYLGRGVIRYFSGGLEFDYSGKKVVLSDEDS
ncbi:hypothetical protein EV678_2595 [Azospira oryzae]|uniref:Membrane protein (DUF2142) n=1 Tax=Azospira oryzae TaxID=146939 RepID=A0ABY0IQM2_9RHOO|nr:hypothetical protein [Azospira oryzae]RZT76713.1 hypothetical protein EV678_2595 [Azospira oryzae]